MPIISPQDRILVTGANGFIGARVVRALIDHGYRSIRCFVRPTADLRNLNQIVAAHRDANIEVFKGNLLSRDDCRAAADGALLALHLAAGIEASFPGCFLNSVVTTRNLLDAILEHGVLRRFVNVSSFSVYSTLRMKKGDVLDENCELETDFLGRAEAYCFGKSKQDELVEDYHEKHGIPFVIVRPGAVYGPGKPALTARVGIGTFGIFLHLGGANRLPLTYVDNCAEVIVLSGLQPGVDNEVFNVVDNDCPTSRQFLRMYKRNARAFRSLYVPYTVFNWFCLLWEKYSKWSQGQLPPAFNRRRCAAYWKPVKYSNEKTKQLLGWRQKISFEEGARRYFDSLRQSGAEN